MVSEQGVKTHGSTVKKSIMTKSRKSLKKIDDRIFKLNIDVNYIGVGGGARK